MISKDPMKRVPPTQEALFNQISKMASSCPIEHVIGACVNVMVNAVRQAYPSRTAALARFDDMVSKCRANLADHYDQMGKRRNVFPYHQTIEVGHFDARVLP